MTRVLNTGQYTLLNYLAGQTLDYNTVQVLVTQHRRRHYFVRKRKLWVRSTLTMVPTAPQKERTRPTLSEQAETAQLLRSGAPVPNLMQKF